MNEDQIQRIVQLAAKEIADAALDLIEQDPHQFSKRPCQTCRAVSRLVGRSFGCVKKAEEQ